MKLLLKNKPVDKSLLTEGSHLPPANNDLLFSLLGKSIAYEEKENINIVVNGQTMQSELVYLRDKARQTIQLRYKGKPSPSFTMKAVFGESAKKMIDKDGHAISIPTSEKTDYINIFHTKANTFMFDCHYKLTDDEKKVINDNFNLLAAAKTKPFLILGGFSGTGKSMKVKELAYLTCPKGELQEGQEPGNYCLISVKPNWHDSTELLGYYSNIGKKYVVTDFIKVLVKAMKHPLVPFYVCMDEMNLAPVEEYFAEYLSVLESRKVVDGQVKSAALVPAVIFADENTLKALNLDAETDKEIIEDLQQNGLCLPQNVIVIGTVNMDDTTNSFSRKVIDRAMTFETKIDSIESASYFLLTNDALEYKNIACPERFICDQVRVLDVMKEATPDFELKEGGNDLNNEFTDFINEINKAMGNGKNYDTKDTMGVSPFQVSYRVLNEAVLYYRSLKVLYPNACTLDKVFADILMMKVLPRIEGEQDRAKKPLEGLQQFVSKRVGDDENKKEIWTECADKIEYMLKPFGKGGDGFTTFWL